MYYLNQFLGQLKHASRFASSKFPQDQRLAVILLDNLLEVDLRMKCKLEFHYDCANWEKPRKHSARIRQDVESRFDKLLSFSRKKGFISEAERTQLSFCHTVRNDLYHGGRHEEFLVRVAIGYYTKTLLAKPTRWGVGSTGFYSSGRSHIRNGKHITEPGYKNRFLPNANSILSPRDHWGRVVSRIAQRVSSRKVDIPHILSRAAIAYVDETDKAIEHVRKHINENDVNDAFFFIPSAGPLKIGNINSASIHVKLLLVLAFFSCCRELSEQLEDLQNSSERHRLVLAAFRKKTAIKPSYPIDKIELLRRSAHRIATLKELSALESYRSFKAQYRDFHAAALDASHTLSCYEEHMYEVWAGK